MSPTPNQKYAPSQPITLYYSGGGIAVPTLTGVPLSTAIQELKSAGFTSTPSVDRGQRPGQPEHPRRDRVEAVPGLGQRCRRTR